MKQIVPLVAVVLQFMRGALISPVYEVAQSQAKADKVPYNNKRNKGEQMTPNWMKNSGKAKKGKGMCKGIIKARKQALKALKAKLNKG